MFRSSQKPYNSDENKISKNFSFTDVIENKGYNFEFPNGENKSVAYLSPKEIYIDNPYRGQKIASFNQNHSKKAYL